MHFGYGLLDVFNDQAFGNFQLQACGWRAGIGQYLLYPFDKIMLAKLAGTDVDGNAQAAACRPCGPLMQQLAGAVQYPCVST